MMSFIFPDRTGGGVLGPAPGLPGDAVTARQWQSALSVQTNLNAIRDVIPADVNDPITIQWFAAGPVRPPPANDPVWTFTALTLGYSAPQMQTLYELALIQDQ